MFIILNIITGNQRRTLAKMIFYDPYGTRAIEAAGMKPSFCVNSNILGRNGVSQRMA
jgi:hypothetical protein